MSCYGGNSGRSCWPRSPIRRSPTSSSTRMGGCGSKRTAKACTRPASVLPESHRESLIGTVAAALGTIADDDHPIVEGELPIERIRFEGLMPPVVRHPCFAMRKPAQVLYTLDDYVRDGIITAGAGGGFPRGDAIAGRTSRLPAAPARARPHSRAR